MIRFLPIGFILALAFSPGKIAGQELQYDEQGAAFFVAAPGIVKLVETFFGEIIPNQNKLAILNPRYAGVVRGVNVSVGDSVKKGELLATLEQNVGLRGFEIRSNISGQVIQRNVSKGEFVNEERVAFVIADLSTVWVRIAGKKDQKPYLTEKTKVLVTSLEGKTKGDASLHYVSNVLDEKMLRITAYGELTNDSGIWLPGQYVNVKLIRGEKNFPLTAPKTAVGKDEWGSAYVFVRTKESGYRKTKVRVGESGLENVSIVHGINPGDEVAYDVLEIIDLLREAATTKGEEDHDDHSDHKGHDHG